MLHLTRCVSNVVAIGAYFHDAGGKNAGHVRVYKFDGTAWSKMGSDIDGQSANDELGRSVALSGVGDTLVAGSPSSSYNGPGAGNVNIYHFNNLEWTLVVEGLEGEDGSDY